MHFVLLQRLITRCCHVVFVRLDSPNLQETRDGLFLFMRYTAIIISFFFFFLNPQYAPACLSLPLVVTVLTIAAVNRWLGSDIAAMVTLSANKAGMSCSNPVACEVALFVSSRDFKKNKKQPAVGVE